MSVLEYVELHSRICQLLDSAPPLPDDVLDRLINGELSLESAIVEMTVEDQGDFVAKLKFATSLAEDECSVNPRVAALLRGLASDYEWLTAP